jgi:hypothetical protein
MDQKHHAPPVPPDDDWLMRANCARFLLEPPAPEVVGELIEHIRAMKAEREGLAGLLSELADKAKEHAGMVAAESYSDEPYSDEAEAIYRLASRAGAAAERLRGGDADD